MIKNCQKDQTVAHSQNRPTSSTIDLIGFYSKSQTLSSKTANRSLLRVKQPPSCRRELYLKFVHKQETWISAGSIQKTEGDKDSQYFVSIKVKVRFNLNLSQICFSTERTLFLPLTVNLCQVK